jgi:hypothetical protein
MKRLLVLAITWFAAVAVAQAASPWPTACIQPITFGQTISGTLAASDCSLVDSNNNHYYVDIYTFSGTAGQQVAIAMNSTAVDAWLDLYNVDDYTVAPLTSDDDGGGGTNARIPPTSGFFTLPTTATYFILANTAVPSQAGAYTVTLTASSTPPTDTTPPTTPAGLNASATSATAINLTWTASTDSGGSGLAGYKVERCSGTGCTGFTQIGTSTTASVSNTGLTAGTTYAYRVRAYDNAGNNRGYSNTAAATTPSFASVASMSADASALPARRSSIARTISGAAFCGEPASTGGCGSYSMPS